VFVEVRDLPVELGPFSSSDERGAPYQISSAST